MSAADRFTPPASEAYGFPPVNVAPLYVPTVDYVVVSLAQEDRIRPSDGKLVPTIAVMFSVPGLPGQFTIRIDNYAFTHADPVAYLHERAYLIRSLYALPNVLPPYQQPGSYASGVYLTLDSVSATETASGADAVAWAGSANSRGAAATARLEVTLLGEFEPALVSDPVPLAASEATVPLAGVLGPLDPGRYTVQLTADSSAGIGLSPSRAVTLP